RPHARHDYHLGRLLSREEAEELGQGSLTSMAEIAAGGIQEICKLVAGPSDLVSHQRTATAAHPRVEEIHSRCAAGDAAKPRENPIHLVLLHDSHLPISG